MQWPLLSSSSDDDDDAELQMIRESIQKEQARHKAAADVRAQDDWSVSTSSSDDDASKNANDDKMNAVDLSDTNSESSGKDSDDNIVDTTTTQPTAGRLSFLARSGASPPSTSLRQQQQHAIVNNPYAARRVQQRAVWDNKTALSPHRRQVSRFFDDEAVCDDESSKGDNADSVASSGGADKDRGGSFSSSSVSSSSSSGSSRDSSNSVDEAALERAAVAAEEEHREMSPLVQDTVKTPPSATTTTSIIAEFESNHDDTSDWDLDEVEKAAAAAERQRDMHDCDDRAAAVVACDEEPQQLLYKKPPTWTSPTPSMTTRRAHVADGGDPLASSALPLRATRLPPAASPAATFWTPTSQDMTRMTQKQFNGGGGAAITVMPVTQSVDKAPSRNRHNGLDETLPHQRQQRISDTAPGIEYFNDWTELGNDMPNVTYAVEQYEHYHDVVGQKRSSSHATGCDDQFEKRQKLEGDEQALALLREDSDDEGSNMVDISIRIDDDAARPLPAAPSDMEASEFIDFELPRPELEPRAYAPGKHHATPPPIVHFFSSTTHPPAARKRISVASIFPPPVGQLWQPKFAEFNHLQSEMANMLAYSNDNIVLSAPTGSGKTVLFEMAMARFFGIDLQANRGNYPPNKPFVSKHRKIVYLSPSKALCEERYNDWSARITTLSLGIEVVTVTGDGDPSESFRDVAAGHVILTTPEKWDSLTRRWTENFVLLATVKLFMIDEVHMLADESRGACLEAIVCRMKTIQRAAVAVELTEADIKESSYVHTTTNAIRSPFRIVAVSATLPNIGEIADFLSAYEAHVFDDSFRPVPLTVHCVGMGRIDGRNNSEYHFWKSLDREVPRMILQFARGRPALVFCHSKADTETVADMLATSNGISTRNGSNAQIAGQARPRNLQRVLMYGVAYHHAGLESDDRHLVETAFLKGTIRVLCATSTLAMGINLPAHLVVIKGTKAWRGGSDGYQELDQASLLQMIGRAGRPGFDDSGTAVIMTDNQSKDKYQRLATSGLGAAKSQLLRNLDEIVNTEISQGVIQSLESAMDWMKTTLYFVQVNSDPTGHGVQVVSQHSVDTHLHSLLHESIARLQLISAIRNNGGQGLMASPASQVMSQHMVDTQAMRIMSEIPPDAHQRDVLLAICAIESMHRPVRRSEKRTLNAMHKMIKYKLDGPPSKIRVQQPVHKLFVLLQAIVGRLSFDNKEDSTLRQESTNMVDFASRMLVALEEHSVRATGNGQTAEHALKLRRSLATRIWGGKDGMLAQFNNLSQETVVALQFSGINSFEKVVTASTEAIEKAAKKNPPFGSNLRDAANAILCKRLRVKLLKEQRTDSQEFDVFDCNVVVPEATLTTTGSRCSAPAVTYTLIGYADRPGGCILYKRNISSPCSYRIPCPPGYAKFTLSLISSMQGLDDKAVIVDPKTSEVPNIAQSRPPIHAVQPTLRGTRKIRDLKVPRPRDSNTAPASKRATSYQNSDSGLRRTPHSNPGKSLVASARAFSHQVYSIQRENYIKSPRQPVAIVPPQGEGPATKASQMRSSQRSTEMPIYETHQVRHVNLGFVQQDQSSQQSSQHQRTQPVANWKHAQREATRSQQRAFVRKSDNPFEGYKHDPNDFESLLEFSSNQSLETQSSIIPESSLRTLDRLYQQHSSSGRQGGHWIASHGRTSGRGAQAFKQPSTHDVLVEKAMECGTQPSGHHNVRWFPPRGAGQLTDLPFHGYEAGALIGEYMPARFDRAPLPGTQAGYHNAIANQFGQFQSQAARHASSVGNMYESRDDRTFDNAFL